MKAEGWLGGSPPVLPEGRQLGDEHDLAVVQHHAVQPHNVGVINGLHDLVLLHELQCVVLHPLLAAIGGTT